MLDAEEARARLEALGDPGWRVIAGTRARKLRRRLRQPAAALLAPDPVFRDHQESDRHGQRYERVAAELDDLSAGDRADLMAALHPALGPALARWWTAAAAQPYTVGWARKAFRAPRHPELTRRTRIADLRRVLAGVGPFPGDAAWLAAWAPHVGHARIGGVPSGLGESNAGPLLAAAVDEGGPGARPSSTRWSTSGGATTPSA